MTCANCLENISAKKLFFIRLKILLLGRRNSPGTDTFVYLSPLRIFHRAKKFCLCERIVDAKICSSAKFDLSARLIYVEGMVVRRFLRRLYNVSFRSLFRINFRRRMNYKDLFPENCKLRVRFSILVRKFWWRDFRLALKFSGYLLHSLSTS